MELIEHFVSLANNILRWPLVIGLLGAGIYLTVRLGLIQFRRLGHGIAVTTGKYDDPDEPGDQPGVSPRRRKHSGEPVRRVRRSSAGPGGGDRIDRDQYSAFDATGLADELRQRGVSRVWIGGLAEDVCVRATALDAAKEGFEAKVIAAAASLTVIDFGETVCVCILASVHMR